jgi:hypothetical protein
MAKQINTATFMTGMQLKAGVTVQLLTSGDVVLGESDYVSTGTKIKVNNGTTITDYTAVVKGDTSGDGNIDLSDLAASKLHLLNSSLLTGPYLAAGDVTGNAGISISDLLFIKKAIM